MDVNDGRCLHSPTPKSSVCTMGSARHAEINSLSLQGSRQTLVESAHPVMSSYLCSMHASKEQHELKGKGMTVWYASTERQPLPALSPVQFQHQGSIDIYRHIHRADTRKKFTITHFINVSLEYRVKDQVVLQNMPEPLQSSNSARDLF